MANQMIKDIILLTSLDKNFKEMQSDIHYEIVKDSSSDFYEKNGYDFNIILGADLPEYILFIPIYKCAQLYPYYFDHKPTMKEVTDAILNETYYVDDTHVTENIYEEYNIREYKNKAVSIKTFMRKVVPVCRKLCVILKKVEPTL